MLVKCKICNRKIERKDAYKIVVQNKNNYYCSEREYKDWIAKREIKDSAYNLIYDIFGYKVTHTILYKEVDELANVYTYEKIFAYLQENYNYLCKVMSKDFQSEYAKIRYFTAILKNSLADFQYKKENVVPKKFDMDFPVKRFNRKSKRKPLIEYETGGE